MKKIIIMTSLVLTTLLLSSCDAIITTEQCNCGDISASMEYFTFEETLVLSTDVVIAQFVERRPFGASMEELEFVVSERIFGDAPERIFVYLHSSHASVMGTSIDFVGIEMEFEKGVSYLLSLIINNNPISNFHEDGYFLTGGAPVVNLDNPIESMMYNEPLAYHSRELDFTSRSLSRGEIVSFVRGVTRDNIPENERNPDNPVIRSNNMANITEGSPIVVVIEINELVDSGSNCAISSDRYTVTVVESLKGDFEIGYQFNLIFLMDAVRIGEQHIVAIRSGWGRPHPVTGLVTHHFTSRHGLFSLNQQQEIEEIIANAPEPVYDEPTDEVPEERVISIDTNLHESAEDMAEAATHVIRGEIIEQRSEWVRLTVSQEVIQRLLTGEELTEAEMENIALGRDLELVTVSYVQVLEVFQGNHVVGDVIEVMQLGGEYGDDRWIVEDTLALDAGFDLVLFLVSWEMIEQPYSLVNHMQGVYRSPVERNRHTFDSDDWETVLENVGRIDPVTLTILDIVKITENSGLLN